MDGTLLDRHFDDHFWEEFVPRHYAVRHHLDAGRVAGAPQGALPGRGGDAELVRRRLLVGRAGARHHGPEDPGRAPGGHPPGGDRVPRPGAPLRPADLPGHQRPWPDAAASRWTGPCWRGTSTPWSPPTTSARRRRRPLFWERLQRQIGFDPDRTLLAEDTVRILETAEVYGIRWLVHVARPSSSLPSSFSDRYPSIETFAEILPD